MIAPEYSVQSILCKITISIGTTISTLKISNIINYHNNQGSTGIAFSAGTGTGTGIGKKCRDRDFAGTGTKTGTGTITGTGTVTGTGISTGTGTKNFLNFLKFPNELDS